MGAVVEKVSRHQDNELFGKLAPNPKEHSDGWIHLMNGGVQQEQPRGVVSKVDLFK